MPNIKKIKINDIVYDIKVETDAELSAESVNPIQNKVVKQELDNKQDKDFVVNVGFEGTADKTWAEVYEAREAGKRIILINLDRRYEYVGEGYDFSIFHYISTERIYEARLYDYHQTVEFLDNPFVDLSGYYTQAETDTKIGEAKTYADEAAAAVKDDLLNGAGEAYDTLKELGELIDENQDAIDLLTNSKSDWAQNNPASLDYIKNRPFYEGADITATVAENLNVNVELDSINGYVGTVDSSIEIGLNKNYVVVFDGDLYTGTAASKTWLGEAYNAITFMIDGNEATIYGNFIHFSNEIALGAHSMSVYEGGNITVHQIDKKFIPYPDENDALELLAEMNIIEPVAADDGSVYTDENGAVYSL